MDVLVKESSARRAKLVEPLLAELGVEVIPNPPCNPTAHSSVEDLNRRIQTGVHFLDADRDRFSREVPMLFLR